MSPTINNTMLSKVTSAAIVGLSAIPITIEVDIASQGLPHFIIVGLPDKSVDEAKERVKSAVRNSGFEFPNKKITVNLAPGDIPKEGSRYDLPIAIGILLSSGQIKEPLESALIFGELSLDGNIRPCSGSVLFTILAKEQGYEKLFVPQDNAAEAALIEGPTIYACESLSQLVRYLNQEQEISVYKNVPLTTTDTAITYGIDMADIQGQLQTKRALEISAAGGHNIIMIGSPGAGKTMLARAFPTILPEISPEESLELTKLYSVSGSTSQNSPLINFRPFRHPHHSGSVSSIIGGGSTPKPGEISLAHRGVLFLDEFLEFPKIVLEALRQPLEDGEITISRTVTTTTFPAKFILLAACNPCPCGFAFSTDPRKQCTCSPMQVQRYRKRLSGPILDRIDLQVKVKAVPIQELTQSAKGESSDKIRERVQTAREIQKRRFKELGIHANTEMKSSELKKYCALDSEAQLVLTQAITRLHLSARSYYRTIKVARTIADLQNSEKITKSHIAESLQYRFTDSL